MPLSLHEPIQEYVVEPELSSDTPRRLRLGAWTVILTVCCLAGYVLVMVCAGLISARSGQLLWLAEDGDLVQATVTGCEYASGGVGVCNGETGQRVERIEYRYGESGRFQGSAPVLALGVIPVREPEPQFPYAASVDTTPADRFQPQVIPDTVIVRYAMWNGKMISYPERSVSADSAALSAATCILIAGVATYILVMFLRWAGKTARILRFGLAVIGTVTSKEIHESDLPKYFVTYGFLDCEGAPHHCIERCTPDQWRRLEIGQPVTVLYPPAQPSRCELYSHLPLRCAT